MNIFKDLSCETVCLKTLNSKALASVTEQLIEFSGSHYQLTSKAQFISQVIQPARDGVIERYSINNKLVGFTRIYQQDIDTIAYQGTVFSSSSWHIPNLNLVTLSARRALIKSLRLKLANPEKRSCYLVIVNSPERFNYLKQVNPQCVTLANTQCKSSVSELIKAVCLENEWQMDANKPCIVHQNFPARERQHSSVTNQEFYKQNPGYLTGDWLMVHIPLELQVIARCLKQSVIQSSMAC